MGSKRQTQTRDPYAPSQPLFQQSADIMKKYLDDPNSTAVYDGQRTVGPSDYTKQGVDALANNKGYDQSRDYMSRTLKGDYLTNNPELANLQQSVRSSVMPGLNATFAKSGMMGGTMHQGAVMRGLTDGMAAPMFQNYENERNRQQQAAGLLPQLDQANAQNKLTAGQMSEGYDRERIGADMQKWQEQQDAPLRALQKTYPMISNLGQQGGTQTTTQQANPWEVGAGVGMMGLQTMMGVPTGVGGFGSLGAGMRGMFGGGGYQGFRQGLAGMHDPGFWGGRNQSVMHG